MKQLILLLSLALSAACSKVDSGSQFSSSSLDALTSRCAPMEIGDSIGFNANIQTVGFITQSTFFDNVQLKLNQVPTAFSEGYGYLEFYQYLLVGNGAPVPDNTPLTFDIVPKSNVMAPIRGKTKLAYSEISALGLNEAMIVIELNGKNAVLLELAYFNSTNIHQGSKMGLLPPYEANPDRYENTKRDAYGAIAAQHMMQYHPLRNDSRGQTDLFYKDSANSRFCYNGLATTMD